MNRTFQKAVIENVGDHEFAVHFEPISHVRQSGDERETKASEPLPQAVFELFVDTCDAGLPN